jgi:hypothetical protein
MTASTESALDDLNDLLERMILSRCRSLNRGRPFLRAVFSRKGTERPAHFHRNQ